MDTKPEKQQSLKLLPIILLINKPASDAELYFEDFRSEMVCPLTVHSTQI